MIVVNRKNKNEFEYKSGVLVKFLYNNFLGRIFLKMLTNKFFANTGAVFMKSFLSKPLADKKVKRYNIDMSVYEKTKYKSYNDFFIRKKNQISFDSNKNIFISPCDSKLMIFKLDEEKNFNIKGSIYSAYEIINNSVINEYKDGFALVFRLDVNDYHRYHYIDDGYRSKYESIKGVLHTVQPIVYDKIKVFHRNSREWCILHTDNFDDVIQVEVGALLVGKIRNNQNVIKFKKGDEKGFFEFGGSTIIMFVKKDVVLFDEDILINSSQGKETIVNCGEKIGQKQRK